MSIVDVQMSSRYDPFEDGRLTCIGMDTNDCSESDLIRAITNASKRSRTDFKEEYPFLEDSELEKLVDSEAADEIARMRKERKSNIKDYAKTGAKSCAFMVGLSTAVYGIFSLVKKVKEIDDKLDSLKK